MKMFKTTFIPLLLLALLLPLAACDDDDDGVTNLNPNDLLGTWVQSAVTINGVAEDMGEVFEWADSAVEGHIAFYANNLYEVHELDAQDVPVFSENGTYEIDNTWLILTATTRNGTEITPEQGFNGNWTIDGAVLTLTTTMGQDTMAVTLTRPS